MEGQRVHRCPSISYGEVHEIAVVSLKIEGYVSVQATVDASVLIPLPYVSDLCGPAPGTNVNLLRLLDNSNCLT